MNKKEVKHNVHPLLHAMAAEFDKAAAVMRCVGWYNSFFFLADDQQEQVQPCCCCLKRMGTV